MAANSILPEFSDEPQRPPSAEEVETVDSPGEVMRYFTRPKAHDTFKHISQDNVLSYLDNTEVQQIAFNSGTMELLNQYQFLKTLKVIQTEESALLTTARSRGGFAAKILVSNISHIEGADKVPAEILQNPNFGKSTLLRR